MLPAVQEAIRDARETIRAITDAPRPLTWDAVLGEFDRMEARLDRVITICSHLNSVASTDEIRAAFREVLPLYSAFSTGIRADAALWATLCEYEASEEAEQLDPVRARRLANLMREFRRLGADLDARDKERLQELLTERAELQNRFSENVLDATAAFSLHLTDRADLAGLPDSAVEAAAAAAAARGLDGWLITLQQPSALPFLQYASNRELRRTVQQAWVNRASEDAHDNRPLIHRILEIRTEIARLLGFSNFADYRLAENMVGSAERAVSFIDDLYTRTLPFWEAEMEQLADFAAEQLGIPVLEAWDVSWASEKLRQATLDFDAEELRPYFSHHQVMDGLFRLTERLFGVQIRQADNPQVWHEDVLFYEIHDADGVHLASFYADWFPRDGKRGGAWMNSFITGGPRPDGGFDPHLALIMGNLTPPADGRPARFTHREVQTVFHEFGHLLHHCLSTVPVRALGGTQVLWDWVEVPSQIMENWTTEPEALALFARHEDTGAELPEALLQKLLRANTFLGAQAQMRQLSFGGVDLALHRDFDRAVHGDAISFGNQVRERYAPRAEHVADAFLCGFTHLFSGAYAAAYYSYKWSEVLEADAFTRFRNEGIFNPDTGREFRKAILETGDSADPNELYERFMGRGPSTDALIARNLAGAQGNSPASSASGSFEAPSE